MNAPRLVVTVDGVALPPEEAAAMWKRFSAHMEDQKGDLAGFAAKEGFASIHPAMDSGGPLLVVSRSAPQKTYTAVDRGGSSGHQVDHRGSPPRPGKRRKRR